MPPQRHITQLLDTKQFHVEHKGRTRRNSVARASQTIAQIGRNKESSLTPDLHTLDAQIPTSNDTPITQRETERISSIAETSRSLASPSSCLLRPRG